MATVKDLILTPDNLAASQAAVIASVDTRQAELTTAIADERRHLAAVRRRIANITGALAEEGKSRALLAKLTSLEIEEAEILGKITRLESQAGETFVPQTELTIEQLSTRLLAILAGGDSQRIHQVLRGLVKRITVERDSDTVRAQIDYFFPPAGPPDMMPSSGTPLGAPAYRHSFTVSVSWVWTRKPYQRRN